VGRPTPGAPPPPPIPRIVEVTVTASSPERVEVRLADGREGAIERSELAGEVPTRDTTVEAALLARTDARGRVLLSQRWAAQHRAWEQVEAAMPERAVLAGRLRANVKGGIAVDLHGLRAFLPTSQFGCSPAEAATLLGTEQELTVLVADRARTRIVVSRREAERRRRRAAEREAFAALEVGRVVHGSVVAVMAHGVQVEVDGGVRGLVRREELSWNRVGDPANHLAVGDPVTAVVTDVSRSRRKLSLSIRRIAPDPFAEVEVGQRDDAVVVSVVEYGAFARLLGSGAEGLVHLSELSEQPGARADQLVMPGETIRVEVIDVDRSRRRLGLSVRRALWS
jgi:ribosomal protein S1